MIAKGAWRGGGDTSLQGIYFNPNMPTEEVFISPKKGLAEGIVHSTMPLSYRGQLIDKFWMRFEGGKVVESHAEIGDEVLTTMLNMDEGARYLGEVAIVPQSSPINQSGILFYETLFDENASCHLAMGRGYNDCIEGHLDKTNEECQALGINDSMIHVDFMIGAPDMEITGYKNGVATPIFVGGEWANQ
jgi:aminopeptidase